MKVLFFDLSETAHIIAPWNPDSSWCGRPFGRAGRQRKSPVKRKVVEGVPTCGRCRMLAWTHGRKAIA